ncbi:MAG: deoxyribose-phosphate aldolase [Candidatus Kapabacteria bacterium]|nr:deoxyribose-phosphate aldolase [Ignavibacteriota bacterium]MCW5884957.1 deoxyribose-phosphate aldolase [Candidatus Kapabacteria bacterium]
MSRIELAKTIDSTILKPDSKYSDIENLCRDAAKYHFASVCVLPRYVGYAANLLDGSGVAVCSVVGFPLGANYISTKIEEAESLIENRCTELDMVINLPALMNKEFAYVKEEIEALAELCHSNDAILKVIIETCLLSDYQKIEMCKIITEAGADYIKTSTGFSLAGADLKDIYLFREFIGENVRIKASGGIRNLEQALTFVEAGASRIGTSSGVKIIEELPEEKA